MTLQPRHERALRELAGRASLTAGTLGRITEWGRDSAASALAALREAGLADKPTLGRFCITPAGRKALEGLEPVG